MSAECERLLEMFEEMYRTACVDEESNAIISYREQAVINFCRLPANMKLNWLQ